MKYSLYFLLFNYIINISQWLADGFICFPEILSGKVNIHFIFIIEILSKIKNKIK